MTTPFEPGDTVILRDCILEEDPITGTVMPTGTTALHDYELEDGTPVEIWGTTPPDDDMIPVRWSELVVWEYVEDITRKGK